MTDIASVKSTVEIMKQFNINPKKNYGQNFIIDANVIRNIVAKANITKNVNVIEIGPGIGALTQYLALQAHKVLAIEIDTRLQDVLAYSLQGFTNVKIIFDDFLKCDIEAYAREYFKDNKDLVVVANLPYYITTPILIKLFTAATALNLTKIIAMMQKEVGQRLSAQVNTKDYNSLSILTQYYCDTKIMMNISKHIFIPQPKVDSVVIALTLKHERFNPSEETLFLEVIRNLFKQRRKTILNNLSSYLNNKELSNKILQQLNIDPKLRPENLTLENYRALSNCIKEHGDD